LHLFNRSLSHSRFIPTSSLALISLQSSLHSILNVSSRPRW